MNIQENIIKKVMRLSVVAALYVALSFALSFLAYGNVQFRVAEILVLLCFFRNDYAISLILGCLIVNLFSPLGILDIIFGTIATGFSVLFIMHSKKLIRAIFYPVLFNGLIVGFLISYIYQTPYIINFITISLGELIVMIFGYAIFKRLQIQQEFLQLIKANKK